MTYEGWIERDGTASIRTLAQKLCTLVSTFGPLIERQWGGNVEMMAALTWARAACTIVPQMDTAFQDIPSADPLPEDWANRPGVNPDRPPFLPPDPEGE
jgi:hypothetical protein